MQRATLLLILCCSAVPALAQNGRGVGIVAVTADHTPCDDAADARGKPATAVAIPRNRAPGLAGTSARTTVKSSLPAASGVSHGGGGDDVDATLQRPRSPKWHSFLPGMFR